MENELIINSSPVELIDIYPTLMELTKISTLTMLLEKAYTLFSGNNLTLFEIMYLLDGEMDIH